MSSFKTTWFYVKNFHSNSIFWKNLIIISLILLIPFASISGLFYYNTLNSIKEDATVENYSTLDSAKNIIDNTFHECDMLCNYLATNDNIQSFMFSDTFSESISPITKLAKALPLIYKYIDSVYIYSEYNNSIYLNETVMPSESVSDTLWLDEYKNVTSPKGNVVIRKKNNVYPILITIIKPVYIADEKRGAIVMNINSQILYRSVLYDKYKADNELMVIDNNNKIILSSNVDYFNLSPEKAGVFPENFDFSSDTTILYDGKIITSLKSSDYNFTYINIYSTSLYKPRMASVKWQIVLTLTASLLLALAIAYIVSVRGYAPIEEIISFLDTNAPINGIAPESQNELKYIINSIKLHIEDREKMEEILEERMAMLKTYQYEMLQAQINPHFLYNTLETINYMAYGLSGDVSENPVSKALVNLAAFFRNTLSFTGYLIPIEKEIQYTKEYIEILKLRYSDLFDIKWNIDKDIYSYRIIKICLQPIIENAVYHGFKPKGEKGLITVFGKKVDNKIIISVNDNGVGMTKTNLDTLNSLLNSDLNSDSGSHIGLANVNKRIKIIFGNEYSLNIESVLNRGTTVYIRIPAQE